MSIETELKMETCEVKNIAIELLELNKGQIVGLPKNPRFIRDNRFLSLVKSVEESPEMLAIRELVVYPYGRKYVVIGGNMRLRACKELGIDVVPCKVLNSSTPIEKLREYAIKDNNPYGEDDWDLLANEWDPEELELWGMVLPTNWGDEESDDVEEQPSEAKENNYEARIKFPTEEMLLTFLMNCNDELQKKYKCTITVK